MTSTDPQVTIGIPVYQGENYLRDALDSVLAQSFGRFAVVLCDNASTDSTPSICEEYTERDARIRFLRSSTNRGAAWNYNRVFAECNTPYFMWLAHDDRLRTTFLEQTTSLLNREPNVALCYGKTEFIDAHGESLGPHDDGLHLHQHDPTERFRAHLIRYRTPTYCNPVFGLHRTRMLRITGGIGPYPSSDIILLAEIALNGPIIEIPEILFERREHAERSVRAHPGMKERAEWFVPGSGRQPVYLAWRFMAEYAKAIRRAPLSSKERLRCVRLLLAEYAQPNQQALRGEARWALSRVTRRVLASMNLSPS